MRPCRSAPKRFGSCEPGEGLVTALVDRENLTRARYESDVVGRYARPDVFTLTVDETRRDGVRFVGAR